MQDRTFPCERRIFLAVMVASRQFQMKQGCYQCSSEKADKEWGVREGNI